MDTPKRSVTTEVAPGTVPAWRTVSWPAVFAGVVLAFMLMAILNMLALGIGIQSIDLTGDPTPFSGVGAGLGWANWRSCFCGWEQRRSEARRRTLR